MQSTRCPLTRPRPCLPLVLGLLLAGPVAAARWGADPLSQTERADALRAVASVVADREPAVAAQIDRLLATDDPEPLPPAGSAPARLLLVERAPGAKARPATRHAYVYLYDYAAQELRRYTCDVRAAAVVEVAATRGTQLPLDPREREWVAAAAYRDPVVRRLLREQHLEVTGEPLANSAQLRPHAFVFSAAARPEGLSPPARGCGRRRCAQVLFTTTAGVTLSLSAIVDLEHGSVVHRLLAGAEAAHGH